jgi:hypothetical protein
MNIRTATAWARRNAIALLALFVALGGTGYAAVAINGKQLKNGTVTGKKLKRDTVTGREVKESKLGTVPSAVRASTAGKADTASTARTADAATDAGTLDGFDSAAFTRGACGTNNGAIHGYARIDASTGFSSTFTTTGVQSAYNCSGQSVEARRIGAGFYEVRFNGAGPGLVVGTTMQIPSASPSDRRIALSRTNDGTYVAAVMEGASLNDGPFVIVLL